MNRKRVLHFLAAGSLACVAGCAFAQREEAAKQPAPKPMLVVVPHWYGGGAIAQTILDLDNDALPASGSTASHINKGENKHGYKVFVGYRLHRNLALEGAYADYGEFEAMRLVTAPTVGTLKANIKIRGWSLEGLGILPFESGFSLFAKGGVLYAMTNTAYTNQGGTVALPANSNPRSRELTIKTGIGATYAFTERLSVRLEYEVAKKVGEEQTVEGDVKALFGGFQYRF